jgi:hypothetical protein
MAHDPPPPPTWRAYLTTQAYRVDSANDLEQVCCETGLSREDVDQPLPDADWGSQWEYVDRLLGRPQPHALLLQQADDCGEVRDRARQAIDARQRTGGYCWPWLMLIDVPWHPGRGGGTPTRGQS